MSGSKSARRKSKAGDLVLERLGLAAARASERLSSALCEARDDFDAAAAKRAGSTR